MAGSTSRGALLLLGPLLAGCMSGHLLDRARRREAVSQVRAAWIDGDRLVVAWEGTATNHRGRQVESVARVTAVPLEPLRRADPPPVDTIATTPLPRLPPAPGRPVTLGGAGAPAATLGEDGVLVLRDPPAPDATLYPGTLTRIRIEPWVWPLLPFTAAVDAVATPVLLILSVVVILPGD